MFDFLFPNHPFGGHTLRLVAQAQQGGGDVFDIARAMKNVEAVATRTQRGQERIRMMEERFKMFAQMRAQQQQAQAKSA